MLLWNIIKGVRFRQLKSVLVFLFKHPIFMVSTIIATFDVVRISQKEFPDTHGFHNKANAFRHALWNIFIAKIIILEENCFLKLQKVLISNG